MTKLLINISHKQAMLFATFLVLYEFLTYIANDMIMPGMLKVVSDFHARDTNIATSLTMYMLGGASLQIFLGPISDSLGRRSVMLFGAGLFAFFTICITCSFSMSSFLIARFFQGMGMCFIAVIGYAVLQEILVEKEAIRLMSVMSNVAILAPLIGPLVGVAFLYYSSWRVIFMVLSAASFIVWWGLWRYMPESIGQTKKNGELISPTILSFSTVKTSYKTLFTNKSFMLGILASSFLSIPCIVWIALSPSIIVNANHSSLMVYGLWQIPVFGAYILGNLALSICIKKFDVVKCIWLGASVVIFGLLGMLIPWCFFPSSFVAFMPFLLIYFFGFSFTSTPLNRYILFITSVGKGTTSAMMSVFNMCAQCLGIEAINFLYHAGSYTTLTMYFFCMGVGFVIFIVSTLLQASLD